MRGFKNSISNKLQGVFLTIILLGGLAIALVERRLLISLILIVAIMILSFTNMIWLRQLDQNVHWENRSK
ncbi:Uncharacterised protein [Streptococcus cristatus]|uniref:Uncharacterized protein n=2 Tax=Streptococcus cristatus TaxID=45634 RepID=A0A512ADK8_STRCR|nr:hypothetical protein [Streptococcus cristatus]AGK70193.1 hypothetical protein I872_00270 [Streptococcus cristatus AS 1.3089]MCY7221152.1 hypothetical protein [Streptococcus cristatus]GEN97732.1 hypothetical protein SOL01_16060 [Streptococcus cristatus]SQI45303.1 Uncharacterised protein [Streptococcus cristatus]